MKILAITGLVLAVSAVAFGAPCATLSTGSPFVSGSEIVDSTDVCTISTGESFSNFAVYADFVPGGAYSTGWGMTVTASGTSLVFGFINLSTAPPTDITIYFQTTGLEGLLLQTSATQIVSEGVCGTPFTIGQEICSSGFLTQGSASNGGTAALTLTPHSGTEYVYTDVAGGGSFTQTFAPEPMTMSLMGIGLLGLGLAGKRMRRK